VMCCPGDDETTAELHTLLVEPWARGHGLGARLVDSCLDFARLAGYQRVTLWTNDPLVAARRIYLSRGFTLVNEEPHQSFGADMLGQTYELDLLPEPA
jgi:N-acetylglutamate synthase-like GNAT family acetyltransferase